MLTLYEVYWIVLTKGGAECSVQWFYYYSCWTIDRLEGAEPDMPVNDLVTPGFASPIRAYQDNLCRMKKSHDVGESEQISLDSLGVLDVDLSLGPDPFGLRAFDELLPNSRMLPGSGPCDLRILIPDAAIGQDGFHDVVIENLLGTSVWRSQHVSEADVLGLRSRWPKAVFQVMKETQPGAGGDAA